MVVQEMSYAEAATACGGELPDYIPKDSAPRIVTIVRGPPSHSNRRSNSSPSVPLSACCLRQNIHQVSLERERVCVLWASQGTDAGCPCGGTHVGDVAEIRGMRITGVRVKKGTTRVSYVID